MSAPALRGMRQQRGLVQQQHQQAGLLGPKTRLSSRTCIVRASQQAETVEMTSSRRALLGLTAGLAAGALLLSPAAHAEPFLASTGGKGFLAAEEQKLYNLRVELEGEARQEIERERRIAESEAQRSQMGKLCATPFGIDIVGITEFIALVGALVGGITARQRKAELERLNEQLRKINMSLRQQARAGTVYAPGEPQALACAGDRRAEGLVAAVSRDSVCIVNVPTVVQCHYQRMRWGVWRGWRAARGGVDGLHSGAYVQCW